jgi:hypothetical protein
MTYGFCFLDLEFRSEMWAWVTLKIWAWETLGIPPCELSISAITASRWWASTYCKVVFIMTNGFCFLDLEFRSAMWAWNTLGIPPCELSISAIIDWRWWASILYKSVFYDICFLFLGFGVQTCNVSLKYLRNSTMWTLNSAITAWRWWASTYCKIVFYDVWFLFLGFGVQNCNASLKDFRKSHHCELNFGCNCLKI